MDARKEILSGTDEPSLESRVADNLMVVPLLVLSCRDCGG